MFPVSRKQALTSLRMQELAPELKKLQEKFKGDRQALGAAQMELYRKHGVNPFGSCWLILLQMPVFLGLYYALQESIHFRLAPFLWVQNLAAPDQIFEWGTWIPMVSVPKDYGGWFYLGPFFNVLPVIAVTLMLFQQKMTMPPPADEQAAMQMKMMKFMMVVMGLMFYKVAAGLCMYFIASSLWGFAERKLLPRRKKLGPDGRELPVPPSLWQKVRRWLSRLINLRQPVIEGAMHAPESSVLQSSLTRTKRKRTRDRRKGDRRSEGAMAASSSSGGAANGEDGAVKRMRGWLAETRDRMHHWWTELLKQAKKK